MTTACNARTPITNTINNDHTHLDVNDPDVNDHVCGTDLGPDRTAHIGPHTCYICNTTFNTHTPTGGDPSTRHSALLATPRPVAISLSTAGTESSDRGPADDLEANGWPGRRIVTVRGEDPLPGGDWVLLHGEVTTDYRTYGETWEAFIRRITVSPFARGGLIPTPGDRQVPPGDVAWDDLAPSEVDRVAGAQGAVFDLWGRTRQMLEETGVDLRRFAATVSASNVELAGSLRVLARQVFTARENMYRFRPSRDADVVTALDALSTRLAAVQTVVGGLARADVSLWRDGPREPGADLERLEHAERVLAAGRAVVRESDHGDDWHVLKEKLAAMAAAIESFDQHHPGR